MGAYSRLHDWLWAAVCSARHALRACASLGLCPHTHAHTHSPGRPVSISPPPSTTTTTRIRLRTRSCAHAHHSTPLPACGCRPVASPRPTPWSHCLPSPASPFPTLLSWCRVATRWWWEWRALGRSPVWRAPLMTPWGRPTTRLGAWSGCTTTQSSRWGGKVRAHGTEVMWGQGNVGGPLVVVETCSRHCG